jgi:prolyl-tRNA editing enzyme YbaK/EbsC (Cys-tRNA(Pro) deacylase)
VPDPRDHPAIQRVLEAAARKGVTLDIRVFDESTHTAEEAAAAVGAELGQIVKSLVFVAPGDDGSIEPVIVLVSGPNRVDLARLAVVSGNRDVRRSTAKEAQELTGYTIGGIPPFGHTRPSRASMDPDLTRYPVVWAAAGTSTAVFPVPPGTLRILANATVAPITEDRTPTEPTEPTEPTDAGPTDAARSDTDTGAGAGVGDPGISGAAASATDLDLAVPSKAAAASNAGA